MRITNLEIHNFRGIKESNICFPFTTRLICLIGAGDSTKSTLLKAIEWILWPTWNLGVCDNDFYNGDITQPIVLRGTFTELPEKLLSEDRFGLYLRRDNTPLNQGVDDEPTDDSPICMTIQLTINDSLEPKWEVVCNRKEAKTISMAERRLFSVGSIGENYAKDFVWGKSSILQKYADAKDILHDAYTSALREAIKKADLQSLDEIASTLIDIGRQYGVGFDADLKNRIMIQSGSPSSSIGLFEGNSPLNQRGTGSQRLLSMGLNINTSSDGTLLLVDEIEHGLEPYRLRSLINELRTTYKTCGQVIITTHSPIAVAECTIDELLIIQSKNGFTQEYTLKGDDKQVNENLQAEVRRNAEAFLCKRIIVCEGRTEIGFIRALDTFLSTAKNYRLSHKGVGVADGGESSVFACAQALRERGYDTCIFMDSDNDDDNSKKSIQMPIYGVPVFDWEEPNSIEEQIFSDVPPTVAENIVHCAVMEKGIDSVNSELSSADTQYIVSNEDIRFPTLSRADQKELGTIAKKKKWFKRIDLGEIVGNAVFESWESIATNNRLYTTISELIELVKKDDRT